MQDGRNVEVTATEGFYNGKTETLRLQNNVVVSSPEYEVLLRDALVNVKAGSVVSDQPVEVKMLQGTVSANRIEVVEVGSDHPVRGRRERGHRWRRRSVHHGGRSMKQPARPQPRRIPLLVATIAAAMLVVVTQGVAQSENEKSPGLFKASPQKRDEPVKITSATLEVRDKSKMATFKGDVHVIQGETDVRCNELVVFYDDEKDKSGAKPKAPRRPDAPAGQQQIRRMEARGIGHRDPEGSAGGRRSCRIRYAQQHRHADRQRRRDERRECAARLADGRRFDHRHCADGGTGGGGRVEGIFNSKPPPKPRPQEPGKQN